MQSLLPSHYTLAAAMLLRHAHRPNKISEESRGIGTEPRVLAARLGVVAETIWRWENGALTQTRAMDRYLRVYFGVPAARAGVAGAI